MEQIVEYFKAIPSSHRSIILVGGIALFWVIESAVPLFNFQYSKVKHAGINIFFTVTSIIVNFTLAFILLKSADWAVSNHFGILQWLPQMPLWLFTILGLLLLDLIGAWFVHWTEHKVKWMWRFHLVHHTDTHVDTTSANRHHPGESVFRFIFTTVGVVLAGAPMWLVFMYQSISVLLSQFNHANIVIPRWLDNAMSWVFVSPDMHKVHHHWKQPFTDSNYGAVFSFWDRWLGTFMKMNPKDIRYGLDRYYPNEKDEDFMALIKKPFQKLEP